MSFTSAKIAAILLSGLINMPVNANRAIPMMINPIPIQIIVKTPLRHYIFIIPRYPYYKTKLSYVEVFAPSP
ncbi:hypothetical protein GCM10007971_27950 [Oceanobacillus indicireducens]|uniref:Uncharacterized protein n=1 Tax=Oceanobacillus indicireducens TaxID=1004261 RepID=A0A918D3P9_9BACI|nr:hypothetical protein GCM10007971_27950 [Oceanobacillus indicireducens]